MADAIDHEASLLIRSILSNQQILGYKFTYVFTKCDKHYGGKKGLKISLVKAIMKIQIILVYSYFVNILFSLKLSLLKIV